MADDFLIVNSHFHGNNDDIKLQIKCMAKQHLFLSDINLHLTDAVIQSNLHFI